MNTEMDTLFHQYLDGRLSAAEAAALVKTLTENPAAAERFAELTRVDEGLRVELKAESRSELFTWSLRGTAKAGAAGSSSATARTGPLERDRKRWIAAAAGLAVLGSGAWWFSDSGRQEALVNTWAKLTPRVKVKTDPGLQDASQIAATVAKTSAAELRRKLKGFAIPALHVRATNINDALATLNRQWSELPHRDPGSAEKVTIALSPEAKALWKDRSQEPGVTLDMPGLSLFTALDLVAAQAGLRVNVGEDSVLLEPDPKDGDTEKKTWTFPVAKGTSEKFLAALGAQPKQKTDVMFTTNFVASDQRPPAAPIVTVAGFGSEALPALSGVTEVGIASAQGEAVAIPDGAQSLVVRSGEAGQAQEYAVTLALDAEVTTEVAVETPDAAVWQGEELALIHGRETDGPVNFSVRLAEADPAAAGETALGVADVTVLQEYSFDVSPHLNEQDPSKVPNPGMTAAVDFKAPAQPWYYLPPNPYGGSDTSSDIALNWATVTKAQQPTVAGWMGSFGVDAGAVSHDTETGVVSVTGDHRVLRTASAALAAMNESAQAGVNMEMRFVDLGSLPEPSFLAGRDGPVAVDAAELEDLCRRASSTPGSTCLALPNDTAGLVGELATYRVGQSSVTVGWGERVPQVTDNSTLSGFENLNVEARATKRGESWNFEYALTEGAVNSSTKLSVTEGEWTAVNALVGRGRVMLFRLRSATVTP